MGIDGIELFGKHIKVRAYVDDLVVFVSSMKDVRARLFCNFVPGRMHELTKERSRQGRRLVFRLRFRFPVEAT